MDEEAGGALEQEDLAQYPLKQHLTFKVCIAHLPALLHLLPFFLSVCPLTKLRVCRCSRPRDLGRQPSRQPRVWGSQPSVGAMTGFRASGQGRAGQRAECRGCLVRGKLQTAPITQTPSAPSFQSCLKAVWFPSQQELCSAAGRSQAIVIRAFCEAVSYADNDKDR